MKRRKLPADNFLSLGLGKALPEEKEAQSTRNQIFKVNLAGKSELPSLLYEASVCLWSVFSFSTLLRFWSEPAAAV
ncbi:hypothetical protein [Rufibacter aurantiacus]|uniref:hypothetical protein n=1 Tax=Rufibacter aurantiacus TaxID=2817374 RepID=UPI001B309558|nr:hypothetical protein [Rufibacter aurantiacus]